MPRAIWSGAISFGLVNVPVRMYSGIDEHKLHFHYLHSKDDSRIGYEKVCKKEDKPVPDKEIVKAFEFAKGEYVYMTDEDFETAAAHAEGFKPKTAKVAKQELEMARQLIESLSGSFKPDKYKDTYRDALCEVIKRKRKGEEVHVDTGAEEEERVPDLMEALRASLHASEGRTNGKRRGGGRNGLTKLSKDELYERAKKADIPGRADMSKEELIEAL